jgi:ribonuclease P protein component
VLPRELRLKERRRFQEVYRRGRFWTNAEMAVHVLKRPTAEKQFGFVVGKKVGGAVQRNRVRRLLREACRSLVAKVPHGVDVVIVARPVSSQASLAHLSEGMQALFQRAGIWMERGETEPRSQRAETEPTRAAEESRLPERPVTAAS